MICLVTIVLCHFVFVYTDLIYLVLFQSDFDEQITQIQNGRCLAELPPVFVPPPPPAFSPNSGGLDTKLEESLSKVAESTPPKLPSSSSGLSPISVKGPTSQPSVSLPAQPKPLIPPPGLQTQSLRQQIPRLANNKAGQVNGQAKNSFEKLVQRLTTTFPQYNRSVYKISLLSFSLHAEKILNLKIFKKLMFQPTH